MMGVVKKALQILCGLAILAVLLFLAYYWGDKDYFEGENRHYIGTSEVTSDQIVTLGIDGLIGYRGVTNLELLENGLVKVDYDLFSDGSYPFLITKDFSYFDTPFVNTYFKGEAPVIPIVIGSILIVVFLFWILNKWDVSLSDATKRKFMNARWYVMHPKHIKRRPYPQGNFVPQIPESVNIDLKGQGILAIRTWKYKDGLLYSYGIGQACWETKTLYADKNPEETNENGVYALRLGIADYDREFMKDIIGIVSLKGDWCEHADGVLRAERCDILHLIVSEYLRPVARDLSSVYGVPVTVAINPTNEYLNWFLKGNGLASLIQNSQIMGGK